MRLAFLSALALLSACSNYTNPDTSDTTIVNARASAGPIQVSSGLLRQAYAQDAAAADVQYVGHELEVSGEVRAVKPSPDGSIVELAGSGPDDHVDVPVLTTRPPEIGTVQTYRCARVKGSATQVSLDGCQ